jgi:protein-disulfide isomerase
MNAKDTIENAMVGTLVICAVIVTALVLRREVLHPEASARPAPPVFVKTWRAYVTDHEVIGDSGGAMVVVFSDFQCPACKELALTLRGLRKKHPSQVAISHRNFPLTRIHPFAQAAAAAAACASRQGRFEAYHDFLFDHQDSIGLIPWARVATQAGITDTVAFNRCLYEGAAAAQLRLDSMAAMELRLTGTPLVLVNGWRFDRAPSASEIEDAIQRRTPEE